MGLRKAVDLCADASLEAFDPNSDEVARKQQHLPLNSVSFEGGILRLRTRAPTPNHKRLEARQLRRIPYGRTTPSFRRRRATTTSINRVSYSGATGSLYLPHQLTMRETPQLAPTPDHARQAFGRGLFDRARPDRWRSSPATVSVYDLGTSQTLKTINLTIDVRSTIHGRRSGLSSRGGLAE